jgi:hypothetical protein
MSNNICDVSIEITPRINQLYMFDFVDEKNYQNKTNSNLIPIEKPKKIIKNKHVTFSKVEIIRVENYKKYNMKISKNDSILFNDDYKCFIF